MGDETIKDIPPEPGSPQVADFGLAVSLVAPSTPGRRSHSPGQVTPGPGLTSRPGLTLRLPQTPQYWSRSNKPAPYKWMAPESLQTLLYSQVQPTHILFLLLLSEVGCVELWRDPLGAVHPG